MLLLPSTTKAKYESTWNWRLRKKLAQIQVITAYAKILIKWGRRRLTVYALFAFFLLGFELNNPGAIKKNLWWKKNLWIWLLSAVKSLKALLWPLASVCPQPHQAQLCPPGPTLSHQHRDGYSSCLFQYLLEMDWGHVYSFWEKSQGNIPMRWGGQL